MRADSVRADDPAPRILLQGDARARPAGLVAELRRAGFQVFGTAAAPATAGGTPDLLLITARRADDALAARLTDLAGQTDAPIPQVVLLADSDRGGVIRALDAGAADALAGGADLPEIVARLRACLRGRVSSDLPDARLARAISEVVHDVCASRRRDEVIDVLVQRVGRALRLPSCAFVATRPGDDYGRVIAAFGDRPARDYHLQLDRYPEILEAVRTARPVVVSDVHADPLFDAVRSHWDGGEGSGMRSVAALPVAAPDGVAGVFLLRTAPGAAGLSPAQVALADSLMQAAARILAPGGAEPDAAGATDALTGCQTVDALQRRLKEEFERARRYSLSFSLVLLDVDQLRGLNERLGMDAGDRLLAETGAALRRQLRAPDFVSRYGGDEFALLLPETGLEGARHSVGRVRRHLAERAFAELPLSDRPTYTAGIVAVPHPAAATNEDLLALAEAALLRGKMQDAGRLG